MTSLVPVDEAIARILKGAAPLPPEDVTIYQAAGRTLAEDLAALRTQPPFAASAMDGYALRSADTHSTPAILRVIGVSAAGAGFAGEVRTGETVRIFTGAPIPSGADAVLLQENVERTDAETITIRETVPAGKAIRPAGLDFSEGERLLSAGTKLAMRELSLAAAMGYGALPVRRKPVVAILSTGDELVAPGDMPGPSQIIASSAVGIAAYLTAQGADARDLGIVADTPEALDAAITNAISIGADVLITLGGASVGEHDLVGPALRRRGMALDFWRIAMRPGKPLMFGRLPADSRMIAVLGLPGNPVSSMVCTLLFAGPLIRALLGQPQADATQAATLGADVSANDERRDYVRAHLDDSVQPPRATPLAVQDSSMLSTLAKAQCLLLREVSAPAAKAGEPCRILRLP